MGGRGSGRGRKYMWDGSEPNQYKRYRKLVFEAYGNKCECCGEAHSEFLAVDHIGGSSKSYSDDPSSKNLTFWLIRNGFPKGFRILCHNCNMAVRWGRTCPHQLEKQSQNEP